MKNYEIDTSEEYEDFVGYVSADNLSKNSLGDFLGDVPEEYKPSVKPKNVDPEFPEEWQSLFMSFDTEEDVKEFVKQSGIVVSPKTKTIIYETENDNSNSGIFNFMGD
jgi:hypothetical protein